MHATLLVSALALGFAGFARANEGIEWDDVPNQCRDQCQSVVNLSDSCDDQSFSSNNDELQCICTGQNMATDIPACEACIRPIWEQDDDDDYEETSNLLRRCNLSAVGVSSTATPTTSGSTSSVLTTATSIVSGPSGTMTQVVVSTVPADGAGAMATPIAGVGLAALLAMAAL